VELMRQGRTPQKAAEEAILTAHNRILRHGIHTDNIAIVCMNTAGESGASCNHQGFWYSHAKEGQLPVLEEVKPVIDNAIGGAGALGFLESEKFIDEVSCD
jgi:hypothetical protein